jgi:hypothetical protein
MLTVNISSDMNSIQHQPIVPADRPGSGSSVKEEQPVMNSGSVNAAWMQDRSTPAAITNELRALSQSIAKVTAAVDKIDPAYNGFGQGHRSVCIAKIARQLPLSTWTASLIAVHRRIVEIQKSGRLDADALLQLKIDFTKVLDSSVTFPIWGGFGRYSFTESWKIFEGVVELQARRFGF